MDAVAAANYSISTASAGEVERAPAASAACQNFAASAFARLEQLLFSPRTPRQTLRASVNGAGQAEVRTDDGYTVRFLGKEQALTITFPEGKTTKIWGDPHVLESDGDVWDFTKTSTFHFGNNKLTIQTGSRGSGPATFADTVSLYNGEDRFTITDLKVDRPRLLGWALDASRQDAATSDGDVYYLQRETAGEIWVRESSGS